MLEFQHCLRPPRGAKFDDDEADDMIAIWSTGAGIDDRGNLLLRKNPVSRLSAGMEGNVRDERRRLRNALVFPCQVKAPRAQRSRMDRMTANTRAIATLENGLGSGSSLTMPFAQPPAGDRHRKLLR